MYKQTRRMPKETQTAIHQVLSTPELLEAILLNLPISSLLRLQRLNRTFNTVISTSPSIQRALFFSPAPASSDPCPNPLLKHKPSAWFLDRRRSNSIAYRSWHWPDSDELKWDGEREAKRHVYGREEASWRRMLVVQPPVTRLKVGKGELRDEGGVRLGMLGVKMGWEFGDFQVVKGGLGVLGRSFEI
jgi:hypothetical protein